MTGVDNSIPEASRSPVDVSPFRRFAHEFASSKLAVVGLIGVVLTILIALTAPWISAQNPYDLAQLDILGSMQPPGTRSADGYIFLLGSDDQGRDMLSAIFYGLRISLIVGLLSTSIAIVIGFLVGLPAGYFGGALDTCLMRLVDLQLSFPAMLVALVLLALLGQGLDKIIFALIFVQWAYYARAVRAAALVETRKEYIQAAQGLALGHMRILFRHLLPNCLPPIIVIATLQLAFSIMLEATLSFLGLGLPITEPSLGLLISNGFGYLMSGAYWISFFPGIALVLVIVSINLVGDRLRDLLNPRLQMSS
jgi:peptide/nickel transport system permease protein